MAHGRDLKTFDWMEILPQPGDCHVNNLRVNVAGPDGLEKFVPVYRSAPSNKRAKKIESLGGKSGDSAHADPNFSTDWVC